LKKSANNGNGNAIICQKDPLPLSDWAAKAA